MQTKDFIRNFQKILSVCFLLVLILLICAFFLKRKYPHLSELLPELKNYPIQEATVRENFSFDYRNTKYNVIPLAEYELWGMVVTHNNINTWYNFYHDKDSVNIKDLCVVWGDNIETGAYMAMKFKSGEWTCYTKYKRPVNRELVFKYNHDNLSNNHLLTDNPEVRQKIRNAKIGDQIYLKGFLAAYGEYGTDEKYYRSSSMSRTDHGNHSCETVFVEDFEILKKANTVWYLIYSIGKYVLLLILALKFILLVIEPNVMCRNISDKKIIDKYNFK
ncbi:MAG: hypothetical protein U9M94_03730 [Patescibacteria group bacterium]|nr:hypothetical protein [Patescibacteria group bacterium]